MCMCVARRRETERETPECMAERALNTLVFLNVIIIRIVNKFGRHNHINYVIFGVIGHEKG